jgi:hypothetical protein
MCVLSSDLNRGQDIQFVQNRNSVFLAYLLTRGVGYPFTSVWPAHPTPQAVFRTARCVAPPERVNRRDRHREYLAGTAGHLRDLRGFPRSLLGDRVAWKRVLGGGCHYSRDVSTLFLFTIAGHEVLEKLVRNKVIRALNFLLNPPVTVYHRPYTTTSSGSTLLTISFR